MRKWFINQKRGTQNVIGKKKQEGKKTMVLTAINPDSWAEWMRKTFSYASCFVLHGSCMLTDTTCWWGVSLCNVMDMGDPSLDPGMCLQHLFDLSMSVFFFLSAWVAACLPLLTEPLARADPRVLDRVLGTTIEQPRRQSWLMMGVSA
jgi:hypothetical protein